MKEFLERHNTAIGRIFETCTLRSGVGEVESVPSDAFCHTSM